MTALSKLALNEDEVLAIYRLLVRENKYPTTCECLLGADDIEHQEHAEVYATALAKLSDAVLGIQERVVMSAVKPGQIWADTYYGSKGRTVRVVEVGDTHAQVVVVTPGESAWSDTTGRKSKVSHQDGRGLRGYKLIAEA